MTVEELVNVLAEADPAWEVEIEHEDDMGSWTLEERPARHARIDNNKLVISVRDLA